MGQKKNIYESMAEVMAKVGAISKNSRNREQGFLYRGVDAVYNALQPALIESKVFVLPEVLNTEREERTTKNGGRLIFTRLTVKYTFYAEDGTSVVSVVVGEGMDSADKSSNKALSACFKYACFQAFCIPTEELIDSDAETPPPSVPAREVKRQEEAKTQIPPQNAQEPQRATEAPQTSNNMPKAENAGKTAVERVTSYVVKSRMSADKIMSIGKHYGVNALSDMTEEQALDYIQRAAMCGVAIE